MAIMKCQMKMMMMNEGMTMRRDTHLMEVGENSRRCNFLSKNTSLTNFNNCLLVSKEEGERIKSEIYKDLPRSHWLNKSYITVRKLTDEEYDKKMKMQLISYSLIFNAMLDFTTFISVNDGENGEEKEGMGLAAINKSHEGWHIVWFGRGDDELPAFEKVYPIVDKAIHGICWESEERAREAFGDAYQNQMKENYYQEKEKR